MIWEPVFLNGVHASFHSLRGLTRFKKGHPPAESGFKTKESCNGTIGTLFFVR
ncbi:Hypothetical protein ACI5QL_02780 [Bacillus velezensis]|uniref:Uncharacterized protein n=1 Tax=Bacillus amyloliquefaciens (strain Y2) TaxID=1155777 RepID=I2C8D4_BACAY|nr:hypothetical protein MUS_3016 [Bacillus velezensis YAU B9601-Y2]